MDKFIYALSFIYIYSAFGEMNGKLQVKKNLQRLWADGTRE
jgi:hypothetical protein